MDVRNKNLAQVGRVGLAGVLLLLFATVAQGMEFAPFNTFVPYDSAQMQTFTTVQDFEERPFDAYGPGPQPPDVQMPDYPERPYGEITPPEEPEVRMQDQEFRDYKGFKPLPPIRGGPMRPMPPEEFAPFKPMGEE